jgi:hypothetical protein
MNATKIKKILSTIKTKKNVIGLISIGAVIMVYGFNNYQEIQIVKAEKRQLEEKLDANKEIIFFNEKSVENNKKIQTINSKIEYLYDDLDATKNYNECVIVQLDRLATGQDVDLDYCEKFDTELETIEKENILDKEEVLYNLKTELEVNKDIYFLCKEVKAKDSERCATFGTLVFNYESGNGTSRRFLEDNNGYGIKMPTDRTGLKGEYKLGTERHLIFGTKEMGSYAFAYYYSKYHIQRSPSDFVKKWAGWNNERYIAYINQNYEPLYAKYKNFLTFTQ